MKEGITIPVHKGKGKDPLQMENYRGITLSSVIAKLLELIILQRLSPLYLMKLVFLIFHNQPIKKAYLVPMQFMQHKRLFSLTLEKVETNTFAFMMWRKPLILLSCQSF